GARTPPGLDIRRVAECRRGFPTQAIACERRCTKTRGDGLGAKLHHKCRWVGSVSGGWDTGDLLACPVAVGPGALPVGCVGRYPTRSVQDQPPSVQMGGRGTPGSVQRLFKLQRREALW